MQFTWTEISRGIGNAPAWNLASRSDDVVSSAAESVAALVQAASAATNSWSVDRAVNSHKAQVEGSLRDRFGGHANGGALVVAGIVMQQHGQSFSYLNTFRGIYARPSDAYSVWRNERRMEAPGTEHRFFWVTRA